ncbi:ABC transporter ATP-binding protein [Clavibacter michiganensis]|uniref:ABC transporter ATP-binding protein n=1 Tax=Clavibacter michiganensis TaxID=28447 RepID=UPI0026DB1496|nr:ATP-binding cassette domain-containing protein [Clavibacter michiganensis]MDO4031360.1 ATP-binding cassette domain-containing protein [Clavibacter michiganensis]MDO4080829.1 ATP-binding cassette domain-containing protein [Clavibacter michiganensis]MDO4087061.1 ATP-binding cassette domain-containing protein [Clavibacter michiganensis]MDO4096387.1 ATP-binding cassette domain-containing protein [Clavibacter michiganensis]
MIPAVEVSGLTVQGGTGASDASGTGAALLRGIDLRIAPGEVVGLSGPSGSGKSTLLHALLGHLSPGTSITAGTVRVHGVDPLTPAGRRLLRGRVVGHMPQDPASALDPARTALHHIREAARRSAGRADLGRLALDAARDAHLDPALLRRRGSELSGGQAQRVILAALLAARPAVVLLDEPTSALDAETTGLVSRHVTRLPWLPTVVIASHDPHVLARTGGRVITLRDGVRGSVSPPDAAPSPDARGPATAEARTAPALPTASAPAVDVSGLRIRFGAHRVVEEASFAIPPGAMLALRGRSGSGKTSVGRAIAGLLVPEAGTLDVAGARIPWAGDDRIRSEKPLVIPVIQDSRAALHPGETVRTALVRAGRAAGRQGLTSADPAELLARFGLDPRLLERRPHQLSGGQRQRVAIARAMASAPTLLVCDEVTASLDATAERMVLDALDEARTRTGVAILLITHSPAAADRAHRVLTLDAGRLA